jgi:MIP family channel proteins
VGGIPEEAQRERRDLHADPRAGDVSVVVRRHLTEAFCTFLLVWVDCAGAVTGELWPASVTPAARAVATGLVIMASIHAFGDVSGAHMNPAVTLAFVLRRAFPWNRALTYWLAQLGGGLVAATAVSLLFPGMGRSMVSHPFAPPGTAFAVELLATLTLVAVVLGTATHHRSMGPAAALASAGVVCSMSLLMRPVSGASMNPARSLCPALVSGETSHLWIFLTAPFLGALLAVGFLSVFHHRRHRDEQEASQGEPK